jgi:hypothetical protein
VPADVQHFGPLLVVATHEDSPDPETYRGDLFSDKAEERMRLLRAIGIESIPELHNLWTAFLRDHAGEDQNRVIAQSIGGGTEELNFGEPGSKQVDLEAGFDESSDHPFELHAIFNQKDGQWTHIATLACRCEMGGYGEPDNFMHPGKPLPQQEWVVTLHRRTEDDMEYHAQEIRFRLRGGLLWPLIEFESRFGIRSRGFSDGLNKAGITRLEPAKLIGENDEPIPGFVLISYQETMNPEVKVQRLYDPKCSAYTWNEALFSYVPSSFKPKTCGLPVPAPKKPLVLRNAQPATGPSPHR